MRKLPRFLLLSAILAMLLCGSAFAADQGICEATKAKNEYNVTFRYLTANDTEAVKKTMGGKQVYEDAVKIEVTYTGTVTADAQYLFVVQNAETAAPTSQTIVYIDQDAAQAGTITFTAYPSELVSGKTYHIYLASSDTANGAITTLTEIAEYSYYAAYQRGDADLSGKVDISDVSLILDHIVQRSTLTGTNLAAADVEAPEGTIDISDAAKILDYIVQRITIDQL